MARLLSVSALVLTVGVLVACSGGASSTAPASTAPGAASASGAAPASDVVVARYADTTITLDAFEARYARSTGADDAVSGDSLSAYREFLDRYLDFRLKVRAARDAGMDTLAALQREVDAYRQQMAKPRLMENEVVEPVVRELYERRSEQVKASHLLIRAAPDAAPSDTLTAYRTAQAMLDSLAQGADFADLARRHSEDPSAQRVGQRGYEGDLGYLTAGQVVKPFEDAMYATPVGETSGVFRTRFGYHILRVHDRRERPQPKRIAHLLLRPDGSTPADSQAARQKADSLRQAVADGVSFEALVREHSDDPQSAARGGDLGFIEAGQRLPPGFERALAAFDSVGAVSDVVETRFGYHLLKYTDQKQRPTYAEAFDDLKQQASRMPRMERQEETFARSVRQRHATSVDTAAILRAADLASADSLARPLLDDAAGTGGDEAADTPIATLGDSTYTLAQLAAYVGSYETAPNTAVARVVDDFLNEKAKIYAAAELESRDPEFAAMMREYREGLLLFQFMQDSVWTVAAQDTAGLRSTFEATRVRYRFPDRVRTLVFRASADSVLAPYAATLEDAAETAPGAASGDASGATGGSRDALVDRAVQDSLVQVDTVLVTDASDDVFRPLLDAPDGTVRGPMAREGRSMLLVRDGLLPARPKTFEEARSAVVRDYQDAYEQTVIDRLRRRYDAEAYPERLTQAFADEPARPSGTTSGGATGNASGAASDGAADGASDGTSRGAAGSGNDSDS